MAVWDTAYTAVCGHKQYADTGHSKYSSMRTQAPPDLRLQLLPPPHTTTAYTAYADTSTSLRTSRR